MSSSTQLTIEAVDNGLPVSPAVAPPEGRIRRRRFRPGLALAALYLALLFLAAVVPGLLAPHGSLDGTGIAVPFQRPFSSGTYVLGTDEVGRDMLSRLVYGARASLGMGLGATGIGVVGGTFLGLLAGLGTRLTESIVMRLIDVVLAIPDILLALVVIALVGTGTVDALFAVGVAAIPYYARVVRAQTHVVRRSPYVEAASTLGLPPVQVIARHVLPNAVKPLIVLATLGIGTAIGVGASLSFLGLGAKPPAAEWGSMLSTGTQFVSNDPYLVTTPAITITLTVLCFGVVGRALRRWSEGRSA
jgi:peptide/nickel transport system permease protein